MCSMCTSRPSLTSLKVLFVLVLLLCMCSCGHSIRTRCLPSGPSLSITHIGNGPAPIVTRLLVYDTILTLQEDGKEVQCRVSPESAVKLRHAYQDRGVQLIIDEIRKHLDQYNYLVDSETIVFDVSGEEVLLNENAIPDSLLNFLSLLDEEFGKTFGRWYKVGLGR